MFISDPSIPDPSVFDPDPGYASKNFSILSQKMVSKLSEIWSGLFIPDPDFLPIPDSEVKKAPDPGSGSGSATLILFVWIHPCCGSDFSDCFGSCTEMCESVSASRALRGKLAIYS
jgi:hypothetical protein